MKIYSFAVENFDGVKPEAVFEDAVSKEIRIAMAAGAVMKDHKAPGAIKVQVLQGEIEFGVSGSVHTLKTLDLIALEPEIVHNLTAKKDSIVRLTLSKNDSFTRVAQVETA